MIGKTKTPDLLFQAHSAPLGLLFYEGSQFPADYKGDAFVALHGSWNRATPTGYKVVRIKFKDGKPVGGYDNFLTGLPSRRHLARPGLGPAGRSRHGQGREPPRHGRQRQDHLAGGLYGEMREKQGHSRVAGSQESTYAKGLRWTPSSAAARRGRRKMSARARITKTGWPAIRSRAKSGSPPTPRGFGGHHPPPLRGVGWWS